MELMKESLHFGRTFVGQRSLCILLGKLCGAKFFMSVPLYMVAAAGQQQGVGALAPPSSQTGGQTSPSLGMFQSLGPWASPQPSAEIRRADINALPGG